MVQVSARFDNQDVSSPYLIQTLGIYAQIGSGSETLLAVSLATSPDQMPAESDASLSAFIYNIQMTIQQASQLTFTVNPAGTATLQDLQDMLALIRRVILVLNVQDVLHRKGHRLSLGAEHQGLPLVEKVQVGLDSLHQLLPIHRLE